MCIRDSFEAKLLADNMNSDSACETTFPVKRVKKMKLAYDESEDTQIETQIVRSFVSCFGLRPTLRFN